jgi:hypothetical protein
MLGVTPATMLLVKDNNKQGPLLPCRLQAPPAPSCKAGMPLHDAIETVLAKCLYALVASDHATRTEEAEVFDVVVTDLAKRPHALEATDHATRKPMALM